MDISGSCDFVLEYSCLFDNVRPSEECSLLLEFSGGTAYICRTRGDYFSAPLGRMVALT